MSCIYGLAEALEIETADLDLAVDFDFTDLASVLTLPDSDAKSDMVNHLSKLSHKATINKMGRPKLYAYVKYARKWLGEDSLTNLAYLSTKQLRQKVLSIFPESLPDISVSISYRDMQKILRLARKFTGCKCKLNGTCAQMYLEMQGLYGANWLSRYQGLCDAANTYLTSIQKAERKICNSDLCLISSN